jgi:hypothetical protein
MLIRSADARHSAKFLSEILRNLSKIKSDYEIKYEKDVFDEISRTETSPNPALDAEIIINGRFKLIKELKKDKVFLVEDKKDKCKKYI